MSQEIEYREQYLPQRAQEPGDVPLEGGPKGNPLLKLLASARRHWLMVLLVWILVGVPGAAAVWFLVKPAYTASGFVKVEPSNAIIFTDVDPQQQGTGFDAFLNTQAQELSDSSVLNAALADPTLKGLALTTTVDDLREALTVTVVPKTHLLKVGVKLRNHDAAIRLCQAVLSAYDTQAGGADVRKLNEKRNLLEKERDRLKARLDSKRLELYEEGKKFAATSETTLEALRGAIPKNLEEAYKEKYRADSEVIQLKEQIRQLDAGRAPATMPANAPATMPATAPAAVPTETPATMPAAASATIPATRPDATPSTMPAATPAMLAEDIRWKEEFIGNDQIVKTLQGQIDHEALFLLRHGSDDPRELDRRELHKQAKKELEDQLAERKEALATEADQRIEERRAQFWSDTKTRLKQQLAAAEKRRDYFQGKIDAEQNTGLDMGNNGLALKRIQDDLDSINRDYKIIDENISKLDIEKRRPERITVDQRAEILPGDIDNKRIKLLPVAVLGALCLGLGLAFLRDLASGRLYCSSDVETGVGVRLLGSLPALEDLRRGRVSEDDFRESYRSIRATLAGASPNGQVPRTLLITSAQAGEGKTSLAVSLAASLAESGCRVLIIDGDVQAPRIATALRLNAPFSLRQVLLGECQLQDAVGATPVPSLDALSAGRNGASAAGLLTQRLAAAVIKSAVEHYDHVVIDSPPILGSADALIWAQVADGVLLSTFAGHSSLGIMRQACARVAAAGGRILGTVICNLSVRESYYSYSSYASARSPSEGVGDAQARRPEGSGRRSPYVLLPGGGAADSTSPSRPAEEAQPGPTH